MTPRKIIGLVFALLAVTLVLGVLAPPAQAGFLTNASFEQTPLTSPGGYICQTTGNSTCISNLTGWSSTCNSNCGTSGTVASLLFAGTNGSAFNGGIGLWGSIANSPDGGNYVAIDGDSQYSASISQSITGLTVGDGYVLSFYQGAAQQNGTNGATTEQWQVTFSGQTQKTALMSNLTHGVIPWQTQTLRFVATSTSTTLTFLALGTPNGGPPVVLLDGLTMTETPEPQTWALVGLGVALLPLAGKRRRRARQPVPANPTSLDV